jgi:hypothetical protein
MPTDVVGVEPYDDQTRTLCWRAGQPDTRPRRIRKSVWDDAEVVINVEHTKPDTPLDDHLRKEQTRALLDLLADYVQKLDKSGDARQ